MRFKPAYTTGEVARICNLSQTTIIRLFDTGVIAGYRVPGSKFRRIPHAELDRFLTAHALPNPLAGTTPPVAAPGGTRMSNTREISSAIELQSQRIAANASKVVGMLNESRRKHG